MISRLMYWYWHWRWDYARAWWRFTGDHKYRNMRNRAHKRMTLYRSRCP